MKNSYMTTKTETKPTTIFYKKGLGYSDKNCQRKRITFVQHDLNSPLNKVSNIKCLDII